MALIRAMGLDYDEGFDETDSHEIDKMSRFLLADETPVFSLSQGHFIHKNSILKTNYRLDFNGEVLVEKSYDSNELMRKNPFIQLMRKCSNKIVSQENIAQQHQMEKMFVSMNMFTECAQHDKR